MIPRRVCLRGFLCYRDEQEIDFTGATLWMLGGPNGSGKSAIFDAVTYALFGHHRAGSQQAAELINKDADGLHVEFDFALDGELYRAKRTLRKSNRGTTTATQGISHFEPAGGRTGRWQPIPDTNRKSEYDAWIRDRLGLSYETFTSSVLLLQGRAEKLLDSTAKGRFEVLAGIVDLDRFGRLHAKADERRRDAKAKSEALRHQLGATPEVAYAELAAIDERIAAAEMVRAAAQADVESFQSAEFQARLWAELQTRAAGVMERWRQAQSLITAAEGIERDAARCRELGAVLPHLETAIKQRSQIDDSRRIVDRLNEKRQSAHEQLEAEGRAADQAQKKRAALQKTIAGDEQRQSDLQGRLRRLEGVRAQVALLEQQQRELERQRAEMARLPADVETRLAAAQAEHEDLAKLAAVVPLLARFVQGRDDLRAARDQERRAAEQAESIKVHGEKVSAELTDLAPRLAVLATDRQAADDAASGALALLKQVRADAEAFRALEGARVCRQCGQPLTPEHFSDELAKRGAEVIAAESTATAAANTQANARQAEADMRTKVADLEKERQAKRDDFRDARRQAEQARQSGERHARDCQAVFSELPVTFRGRIASNPSVDWLATSHPTATELGAARSEIARLDAVRARLKELQEQHIKWTSLRGQARTLQQSIEALAAGLPAEPDEVHRDFQRTEAEEQALAGGLKAARAEARTVQEHLDRLTAERQEIEAEFAAFERQIHAEEVTLKHCRQNFEAAMRSLPDSWSALADRARLSELHGWQTERASLIERDVEGQSRELDQTRAGLEALRNSKQELDQQIEMFPAEGRRPLSEIQGALAAARRRREDAEVAVGQCRQARALLEDRRERRADLQAAGLDADRQYARAELLATLLGRERLQLHLVRTAERQIVDHANAVLDRLSGGQLYLRLRAGDEGTESDKALGLEAYNRTTGGGAIGVAFLSGSQRFRVAVSLALGIGRFASRRHRPIESVIIDEGFGCLDRNGRQVMIQELQNLRGHLECILLVSHQEEFAEAFYDGYRFELTEGTTRIRRVGS